MVFGAVFRVEKFTIRKFLGVIASIAGIILISRLDMSSSEAPPADDQDDSHGSFPHKSSAEVALGDAMAGFSAIMYGVYTIVMKRQVGDESRVNMALFFGLVGFFNTVLIWPGFIIMHFTGIETFELPPTNRVWCILLVCHLIHLPLILHPYVNIHPPGKLRLISTLRHPLGLFNAPHDSPRRNRRPQSNDPTLSRGPDSPAVPVRQSTVLGWCCHRIPVLFGCQP